MISMFNTHNSTNKFAVVIDGHLGLFETESEANEIYESIGSIEDSAFGSAQIIPANYICTGCMHDTHDDVALHISEAEDLLAYVKRSEKDLDDRVKAAKDNDGKMWDGLFDNATYTSLSADIINGVTIEEAPEGADILDSKTFYQSLKDLSDEEIIYGSVDAETV